LKRACFGGILVSSLLFIICLLLIWVYVAVLPPWLTDPYTYSAYKKAKQLSSDLEWALNLYSKSYGMANSFSDFTTIYDSGRKGNSNIYSFEGLLDKGVKVGTVEKGTLKFNNHDLDGDEIEVRWQAQNVTAKYKLRGNVITTHIKAIFNMGEVIDQEIVSKNSLLL
jgi:hypothetical protein